jgi:hypothetical protein
MQAYLIHLDSNTPMQKIDIHGGVIELEQELVMWAGE